MYKRSKAYPVGMRYCICCLPNPNIFQPHPGTQPGVYFILHFTAIAPSKSQKVDTQEPSHATYVKYAFICQPSPLDFIWDSLQNKLCIKKHSFK